MSDELIGALQGIATSANAIVGTASWYIFGSVIRDDADSADIDLLVVCQTSDMADSFRQTVDLDCLALPIHLSIFTEAEEAEIRFVERQSCMRVF